MVTVDPYACCRLSLLLLSLILQLSVFHFYLTKLFSSCCFGRLLFLLASLALYFRSYCGVGYRNFTFVQTARAFAVPDLTTGLVVLWLVAGGAVDLYACFFFDQWTILSLPFMRYPRLFLTLVCQLYLVLVDSAAECSGVALTVSTIILLGFRGRWCFLDSVADCCFVWFFTKTTPALSSFVSKKKSYCWRLLSFAFGIFEYRRTIFTLPFTASPTLSQSRWFCGWFVVAWHWLRPISLSLIL